MVWIEVLDVLENLDLKKSKLNPVAANIIFDLLGLLMIYDLDVENARVDVRSTKAR